MPIGRSKSAVSGLIVRLMNAFFQIRPSIFVLASAQKPQLVKNAAVCSASAVLPQRPPIVVIPMPPCWLTAVSERRWLLMVEVPTRICSGRKSCCSVCPLPMPFCSVRMTVSGPMQPRMLSMASRVWNALTNTTRRSKTSETSAAQTARSDPHETGPSSVWMDRPVSSMACACCFRCVRSVTSARRER